MSKLSPTAFIASFAVLNSFSTGTPPGVEKDAFMYSPTRFPSSSSNALFTPTIADTNAVIPTIAAVHGFDNPISFNDATATAAPPAIFASAPTTLSAPLARS